MGLKEEVKDFRNKEFKYENYQVDDLLIQFKILKKKIKETESESEPREETPTKIVQIDLNKNKSGYAN